MTYKRFIVVSALIFLGVAGVALGYFLVSYGESVRDSPEGIDIQTRIQKLEDLSGFEYRLIRDEDRINYNLAVLYVERGDLAKSIIYFQGVIESSENAELRAKAHYNIGVIFLRMFIAYGDLTSLRFAVERFQNALRENPNEEDARYNLERIYSSSIVPGTNPANPGDSLPGYGEGIPEEDF